MPENNLPAKTKETIQKTKETSKIAKLNKESVNEQFLEFINETVTVTFSGDTPEEVAKAIKLLKSDEEPEEEVEEHYQFSDRSAFNALTLGTPMLIESVEKKNYLKDGKGNTRKYMMRRAAAKDAHLKNGEVEKQGNFYVVKLKESNDVEFHKEHIQEEGRSQSRSISTSRVTEGSSCGGGASCDCGCGSTSTSPRTKISFTQAKKKLKEKINEIDMGIEPGMAMSGWNQEIIGKDGKAKPKMKDKLSELTGDETTASIGDQKEDELKKQGISLASFKKKNYL